MAAESSSKSPFYEKLVGYGIETKVAEELDACQKSGLLSDAGIDDRAMDAIKEFTVDQALEVLEEFKKSNLEHVANKSAFICGVMKTYRQKHRTPGSGEGGASGGAGHRRPGPDEAKLKAILDRTGYSLDVTTGQRKYGGPPPNWDGTQPGSGHEVFCGRVPKDVFEDELIPHFEKCGKIWDLRLMMDPMTGLNRGFCFVTFVDREGAQEAVKRLNGFEIKPGKLVKINLSVANVRLFVGNIPKNKSKDDIFDEFKKQTDGLVDVIIYSSPDDPKKKNRGFAFLEYDSHKSASMAKHRIGNGWTRVWGCDIIVDWADLQEQPDEDTMSKVKVLYVRNLKSDVTEDQLREKFEQFGKVERVKKVKDYGFVHFDDREHAIKAMQELNGQKLGDSEMQISLAKPPTENKQKEKRKQQYKMQYGGRGFDDFYLPPYHSHMMSAPLRGGRVGMGAGMMPPRPPLHGRGGYRNNPVDYEYPYSYGGSYGNKDVRGGAGGFGATTDDYDYYTGGDVDDYYYGGGQGIGGGASSYMEPAIPRGGRGGMMRGGGGISARGGHAAYWSGGPSQQSSYMPQWGGAASGSGGPRGGAGSAQWGGMRH